MADASIWTRLNAPIDGYCERLSPDFIAEPVNAVSNLAFMIAAYALGRLLAKTERETGTKDYAARALIIILWCISLGSLAFHTFGTVWAAISDSLPIAIFIYSFVYLALRRYYDAPHYVAALGPPTLIGLAYFFYAVELGGPSGYLPALIGLIGLGLGLIRRAPELARSLFTTALVFATSLTLRTLDMPLCANNALGTHWAWHVLNALTLFLVTQTFIAAKHRDAVR